MPNSSIIIPAIPAPTWKTSLLLHFDEAANATSFASAEGKTATGFSGAKVSTNAFIDGNSCVIPTGAYVSCDSQDFVFGTGDFTMEAWIGSAAAPGSGDRSVLCLSSVGSADGIVLGFDTAANKLFIANGTGSELATGGSSFSWSEAHIAYSRVNGIGYLHANGVLHWTGSDPRSYLYSTLTMGQITPGNTIRSYVGYVDEVRITKGRGRYTGAFTPEARLGLT